MGLVAKSFHWLRNNDNSLDGKYPLGDKPPEPVVLAWDLTGFPTLNRETGTAFSYNVRQHLSGTQAATAVITLANITGDEPLAAGWVAPGTGSDLTHNGVLEGAGSFVLRATGDAGSIDTVSLLWEFADPAGAEFPGVVVSSFEGLTVGQLTADQDPVNWISGRTDRRQFIRSTPTFGVSNRCTESFVDRDDAINTVGERCELRFGNPSPLPTSSAVDGAGRTYRVSTTDYWWGYAVRPDAATMQDVLVRRVSGVPSSNSSHETNGIFSQLHRTKDTLSNAGWDETENNPVHILSMRQVGTFPNKVYHWFVGCDRNPNTITNNEDTISQGATCGPILYNSWTEWVFRCRFDAINGYFHAWKRDANSSGQLEQVINVNSGFGFRDVTAPYLKIGLYRSSWDMTKFAANLSVTMANVEKRTALVYYASWRWYYGNDGTIAHVTPR